MALVRIATSDGSERPRLDEIARVVDLSGNHRLGGAAEVRVWFILPPFDR